ncbi:hypothetical protein LUZ60_004402 [Juncus effusus]|nr:hypothetical protein LUZ60_004402 [Juncus effusus]
MAGLSKWDGSLSLDEFNSSATALIKRWNEIESGFPNWIWVPCCRLGVSSKNEGYLALEKMCVNSEKSNSSSSDDSNFEENISSSNEELSDEATLVEVYNYDTYIYDFHIVYSFSYRVPVLYFRAYQSDGNLLSLDEIKKSLPQNSLQILHESKWTFMTQEEHPYLKTSWYTLHPCGTSDWMRLLLCDHLCGGKIDLMLQYLPAWLSVIGQAVGLRIPLELYHRSS